MAGGKSGRMNGEPYVTTLNSDSLVSLPNGMSILVQH